MKYEAMHALRYDFSVRKMAKVLNLKESAYYQWKARYERNARRREAEAVLAKRVRQVFEEHESVYGYRKMQTALVNEGVELSYYRVRKIMRETGLYPESAKKYKPAGSKKTNDRYLENKLEQNFKASAPNELWAGDITYIKTKPGYVYLATVIDLYSKEIIGYSISKHIDTELTKRALANALVTSKRRENDKTIFHSDRGCQYTSKSFQKMLAASGIEGSMSRAGCPYDNAPSESLFSAMKRECIYRKDYANIEEVKQDLFRYIELFYNRKRLHASLGYVSPQAFRQAFESRKVNQQK